MDERLRQAIAKGYWTPIVGRQPWNTPLLVPKAIDGGSLSCLLGALTCLDEMYLRAHPETPWLYASGLRYELEPPGQEQWLTIPYCLMRLQYGGGIDCEDASCWRAAELRVRKLEPAQAIFTHRVHPKTGKRVYHIRVQRADRKRVEDPSMALGMGSNWAEFYGPTHSIIDGEKYT